MTNVGAQCIICPKCAWERKRAAGDVPYDLHMATGTALRRNLLAAFVEHPASAGESYGQHCRRALRVSWTLAGASMAAVVHALVPGLFTTRASDTIFELHDDLVRIRASQETV